MSTPNLIYRGLKANLPATRNATSFYLLTDTRELYFGDDLYTEAVRFFTSTELVPKPTNPAQGVVYVDEANGNGYAWDGTSWKTVFEGAEGIKAELIGTASDDKDDNTIYGAKAYADDAVDTAKDDADGSHYTSRLDIYSGSWKAGKTVTVYYNPNDPSVIHGSRGFGIYLMVLGAAIIAVVVIAGNKNKKALAELEEIKAKRGGMTYAPSVKGIEREVYFLTDTGTMKYGHRIENRGRKVLYEAKVTQYSMAAASHFDFIDHEHGATTQHLVSGTEDTENNSILFDNHYTFDFDGEDIWQHLRRNGVSVETERQEGTVWPRFRVSRDGEEIAVLESTSQYVHEEDEEQHKVMGKIAVPGYYRIWTREENLDVVFITAMAFGRSRALNDEGGTYGKMMRRSLKKSFGKK